MLWVEESCSFSSEAYNQQLPASKTFQMAGVYLRKELDQRISLETLPMRRDPLHSLCHSVGSQTSPGKQTAGRD